MQLATVIGKAHATVKHRSLNGWRMLIIQPLDIQGEADGDPAIAVDHLGSPVGGKVMFTADGSAVRDVMQCVDTPVRYVIIGIIDEA